ncbi:MAG: hypothetical protein AAF621_01890 [Pseudomonadota bacterium]
MTSQQDIFLELVTSIKILQQAVRARFAETTQALKQKDAQIFELKAKINALEKNNKSGQLRELESQLQELSDERDKVTSEKHEAQKLLYAEMNKVDKIQMELELAEREKNIALRNQGINSEQKKLMMRLERENFKIEEALERIEYISDIVQSILEDEATEREAV